MSGLCGWHGLRVADAGFTLAAMGDALVWPQARDRHAWVGEGSALAVVGAPAASALVVREHAVLALHGHPSWRGEKSVDLATFAHGFTDRYRERGLDVLAGVAGDFSLALLDRVQGTLTLAVDRVGIRNIVYQTVGDGLVFGATSDALAAHPAIDATIVSQALYDYVYFHMIPGPETVFASQRRILPAHALRCGDGKVTTHSYWRLRFEEPRSADISALKPAFREALAEGVRATASGSRCGAFLSGGTDSSTVTGILAQVAGTPPATYSIGFAVEGFDEMDYARISARHVGSQHHEYYVTPDDVVAAIPAIARAYDQPFGNASAIPTYFCARMAVADGVERMLGGDGGDELFGGNARYAKQRQLARYERIPAVLRRGLLEPILLGSSTGDGFALLRKARSYVEQASLPMPARYESYNLLERLGPQNVFAPEFLAAIDRAHPLAMLTEVYAAADAGSLINRMLALDLKFTLADNDLPKVTRTCELAGIDVAFPLLHEAVVDFSAGLPPDFKLRGTELRYFFKRALDDFLAPETLAKQKHGFGLPAGPWMQSHPSLRALARESLASLRERRIFRNDLLDALLDRHLNEHPGYYGTLVWILMMLEQWFACRPRTRMA